MRSSNLLKIDSQSPLMLEENHLMSISQDEMALQVISGAPTTTPTI